jgi:hypothetical protein
MSNENNPINRIKSSLIAFRKDPSFIYIVLFLIGFVFLMIKSNVYDPYYLNNYPSYTAGYIVEFYSSGRGSPRTKYCYEVKGIEYCGELAGLLTCHPNCKGNKFLVKYSWKKNNISHTCPRRFKLE